MVSVVWVFVLLLLPLPLAWLVVAIAGRLLPLSRVVYHWYPEQEAAAARHAGLPPAVVVSVKTVNERKALP